MPIYVSTSCLLKGHNVFDVLNAFEKAGLKNVELGSVHKYIENLSTADFKKYGFNFICHHYFPPPLSPFVINLASRDPAILARSREQVKQSIDFCASLDASLFSVHAGFRADPDNKMSFRGKTAAPYESAMDTFIASIKEIGSYAARRKVRIAVENNVLAGHNMVDGKNPYLLLCEAGEFEHFFKEITSPDTGVLLDLGHLNVTAISLGFDRFEFITSVKDRVFALHIHENNGQADEHRSIDKDSWCLEIIRKFAGLPVVIESSGQSIEQIKKQVKLAEKIFEE